MLPIENPLQVGDGAARLASAACPATVSGYQPWLQIPGMGARCRTHCYPTFVLRVPGSGYALSNVRAGPTPRSALLTSWRCSLSECPGVAALRELPGVAALRA